MMELRRRHPEPVEPAALEAMSAADGTKSGRSVNGVPRRREWADHRDDATDEVRAAVDELPEDQRVSIVLYHIDGFSQKEIAESLDVRHAAIKKWLQRGRDAMRMKLEQSVRDSLSRVRPSRSDEFVETVSLYASFDMAAQLGQFCPIEAMLAGGIDVNQTDAAGRTAAAAAKDRAKPGVISLLVALS